MEILMVLGICAGVVGYCVYIQYRLWQCKNKDPLTRLPNLKMLEKDFKGRRKGDRRSRGTLIVLSIRNLAGINNTYGHLSGDCVMSYVGCILDAFRREHLKAYKIWGERFALMMPDITDEASIERHLKELLVHLDENIYLHSQKVKLVIRIGAVLYDETAYNIKDLLGKAELAIKQREKVEKSGTYYFDQKMFLKAQEELDIEQSIRDALEEKWFYLCYQPKIRLKDFKVDGLEALLRLEHPKKGLISPDIFIEVAEATGLIIPLGWWVIRESIAFICHLNKYHHMQKQVAINVSVLQLVQDHFVEDFKRIMDEYEVEASWIQLELTETVFVEMNDYVVSVLKAVKDIGVQIAIDDFGKGYSNLNYLQYLPIDFIKIDKVFVHFKTTSKEQYVLLKTILKMCKELDFLTVAEGVETEEELRYLVEHGCDFAQGYFFSRPVREEAVLPILNLIETKKWL